MRQFFEKKRDTATYKISEIYIWLLLDNQEFLRNVRKGKVYVRNIIVTASSIVSYKTHR